MFSHVSWQYDEADTLTLSPPLPTCLSAVSPPCCLCRSDSYLLDRYAWYTTTANRHHGRLFSLTCPNFNLAVTCHTVTGLCRPPPPPRRPGGARGAAGGHDGGDAGLHHGLAQLSHGQ